MFSVHTFWKTFKKRKEDSPFFLFVFVFVIGRSAGISFNIFIGAEIVTIYTEVICLGIIKRTYFYIVNSTDQFKKLFKKLTSSLYR